MRAMPLHLLTWGTVAAAVGSAVWLSNTDQAALFCSVGYQATSSAIGLDDVPLPAEPARAGSPSRTPGSGAARSAPALAS